MRRDEDWFDAVGKDDWRVEQIEKREKERLNQANADNKPLESTEEFDKDA